MSIPRFDKADIEADPKAIREIYQRDGIVVVRGLIAEPRLEHFRSVLRTIISVRLKALNIEPAADNLDSLFAQLAEIDQNLAMDVIRISKDLPEFYEAFTDPDLLFCVRACLGSEIVQSVHDIAQIRIDPPDYYKRNFDWHQDYPYNVASQNAVTAWWPLTSLTEDMGFLRIVPGSHKAILPVRYDASRHKSGSGTFHSTLNLDVDRDILERDGVPLDGLEPGDVALFHCLVVHRSGLNTSNRARWVMNPRYADALDPVVIDRGWRTVRDNNQTLFRDLHADVIREAV